VIWLGLVLGFGLGLGSGLGQKFVNCACMVRICAEHFSNCAD